ncbi:chorismate-binding protein [Brucella abortus]|nr:chorismate-binding protein [Brucella abortus]
MRLARLDRTGRAHAFPTLAIRTISLLGGNRAIFNVGGGVVFDSTAQAEYEECL